MVDYKYDVFISYRRKGPAQPWIAQYLHKELRKYLSQELPTEPELFWDETGVREGDEWKTHILDGLHRSKCILLLWSTQYFRSPWCVAEWMTFWEREKAEKLPRGTMSVAIAVHDGEEFPADAKAVKAPSYYDYVLTAPGYINTDTYVRFEQAVKGLATTVGQKVREVRRRLPYKETWPKVDPDEVKIDDESGNGWSWTLKAPDK